MGRMGEGDSQSFPKTVLSPVYRWRCGGSEIVSNFLKATRGQVDPILTSLVPFFLGTGKRLASYAKMLSSKTGLIAHCRRKKITNAPPHCLIGSWGEKKGHLRHLKKLVENSANVVSGRPLVESFWSDSLFLKDSRSSFLAFPLFL